ncbi:hypothetical protein HGA64_04180 [Candidatus Falkowbacteria bacterium]|nr:hypothetical protein [Candidatus Falkowbacteria bacterium]
MIILVDSGFFKLEFFYFTRKGGETQLRNASQSLLTNTLTRYKEECMKFIGNKFGFPRGRTALISVSSKDGIVDFVNELLALGWNILASRGTASFLADAGIEVVDVATKVGKPILGHRVVTLSREIHAGLLAQYSPEDIAEMEGLNISYIDLVCIDFYPMEKEIAREGSTPESVIEKTDIGGPTALRSGTKGQRIVVCDPPDRQRVIDWLKLGGPRHKEFVTELGAKAEFTVAKYCLASATYHGKGTYHGFMGKLVVPCKGENGYQSAGLYSGETDDPLALDKFKRIEGKELSHNNWADVDRLLATMTKTAATFDMNFGKVPEIAIAAKHGNPCGVGALWSDSVGGRLSALEKMIQGDLDAIFGGFIMVNFTIGKAEAEVIARYKMKGDKKRLLDGIIAPWFSDDAISILRRTRGGCRFLINEALFHLDRNSLDPAPRSRYVRGGRLVQDNYAAIPILTKMNRRTRTATDAEEFDMLLAIAVSHTSNSNTITLVRDGALIGNGAGRQSRVGAAKLALSCAKTAGHVIPGASAASDSFFPFPDGAEVLASAGITTLFTTSGSVNDEEVFKSCREWNMAVYTLPDSVARGFFAH